jgi:hypothetical protein
MGKESKNEDVVAASACDKEEERNSLYNEIIHDPSFLLSYALIQQLRRCHLG